MLKAPQSFNRLHEWLKRAACTRSQRKRMRWCTGVTNESPTHHVLLVSQDSLHRADPQGTVRCYAANPKRTSAVML